MHDNPRGTPHTLTMANPTFPAPSPSVGNYRWRILAMLFAATTINYMDRSVLGVLAPTLQYKVFHWTDQDYATITNFFNVAYAIGMAQPISILVETFGTHTVEETKIEQAVRDVFDLRPAAIVRDLELKRPIYRATAAYGHFGRTNPEFTWEQLSKLDDFKSALS